MPTLNLSTYLKEARKRKKLTTRQLASLINYSAMYISLIEHAKVIPTKDTLKKVCKELDIKYNYVLSLAKKATIIKDFEELYITNNNKFEELISIVKGKTLTHIQLRKIEKIMSL